MISGIIFYDGRLSTLPEEEVKDLYLIDAGNGVSHNRNVLSALKPIKNKVMVLTNSLDIFYYADGETTWHYYLNDKREIRLLCDKENVEQICFAG